MGAALPVGAQEILARAVGLVTFLHVGLDLALVEQVLFLQNQIIIAYQPVVPLTVLKMMSVQGKNPRGVTEEAVFEFSTVVQVMIPQKILIEANFDEQRTDNTDHSPSGAFKILIASASDQNITRDTANQNKTPIQHELVNFHFPEYRIQFQFDSNKPHQNQLSRSPPTIPTPTTIKIVPDPKNGDQYQEILNLGSPFNCTHRIPRRDRIPIEKNNKQSVKN